MSDDVMADFAASASRDLGRLLDAAGRTVNTGVLLRVMGRGHPDLRPSHLPVFAGLERGGTRISVLAAKAGVSRQAMGAMVREVESLGYIQSEPDPADGRATRVSLTEFGVDFCRTAITASTEMNVEIEELIGTSAAERLRRQLRTIAES